MKKLFCTIVTLGLLGCEKEPVANETTNNVAVPVALLFEHDGCRVYRFSDAGRRHYYTDCRGATISTRAELMGNTIIQRDEEIQTVAP